ncbi:MAG: OsmC family protein [Spirochaetales bacterium]|nr:OsmC family protein [Spirochaetales bacterium]
MAVRKANAVWQGTLKQGSGRLSVQSRLFQDAPYSFGSRFEEEKGTNPEELIGAAFAGCFSQAFALELEEAGYPPTRIETTAGITLEKAEGGFKISKAALETSAQVEAIDEGKFRELAEKAKNNCPVSKALAGIEKSVQPKLIR